MYTHVLYKRSSEEDPRKPGALILTKRIACTQFLRLATRRGFHGKSTVRAPGGELRKHEATGGGGQGFPISCVASPLETCDSMVLI